MVPKSYDQAAAEVRVTRKFYENFGGDQVRFLARGFTNPGDHPGQSSSGYRWPYGAVAIITPFNFPLEIPALQLMGALYMGNKPLLHVDQRSLEYVARQCDQDAYACSGQKCCAQSMLFAHSNWVQAGLLERMKALAASRKLSDLTIGPVLTWTTEAILAHTSKLLQIPGAKLLFGGRPLADHSIPAVYGAVEPTAVFVPLAEALKPENFGAVTSEVFGPFQVVTEWRDGELPLVLEACERMSHHLTTAVVSNDVPFVQQVLAHTVNGTTYAGIRARTTGAPQNHWFGPAGDPRGTGIGTPEAIRLVWSCHREIINDWGPVPDASKLKAP